MDTNAPSSLDRLPLRCVVALGAAAARMCFDHVARNPARSIKKLLPDLEHICALADAAARGDITTIDGGELYSLSGSAVDAGARAKDEVERAVLDALGGAGYAADAYVLWATGPAPNRDASREQVIDNVHRAIRGASAIEGVSARLADLQDALAAAAIRAGSKDTDPAPDVP